MRRKIGSLAPERVRMGFVGGALKLFAVNPSAVYIAIGAKKTVVDGTLIRTPGVTVRFSHHLWSTHDQAAALAMIENETNFDRTWGFYVEEDCIPGALADLFGALSTDGKYVVAYRLAEGKATVEEIVKELKEKGLLGADGSVLDTPEPVPFETSPLKLSCPVCAKEIEGANAQAVMKNHVRSVHPDWKEETAVA